MHPLYFDYAASTPLDPRVKTAMEPFLFERFGNPSSIHSFGRAAQAGIDGAREAVAKFLNCQRSEVIFTSGATEANNLAIQGLLRCFRPPVPLQGAMEKIHIITSPIEHPSVRETILALEKSGVTVTWLPVDAFGRVHVDDVVDAMTDHTVLVSVMYVNNELGTVQPIAEIGNAIQEVRKRRMPKLPLYFHCDAVQAAAYYDLNVDTLGVDLLTISAHKMQGPKGTGVLYVRDGTRLAPLFHGGHQEYELRPGTPHPALIVGCGAAVDVVTAERQARTEQVRALRTLLVKKLTALPGVLVNSPDEGAPHIVNVSFAGKDGANLVMALDLAGVSVSTGAACAAGALEPSRVLQACGLDPARVQGAIRISFGAMTTKKEIQALVERIVEIIS